LKKGRLKKNKSRESAKVVRREGETGTGGGKPEGASSRGAGTEEAGKTHRNKIHKSQMSRGKEVGSDLRKGQIPGEGGLRLPERPRAKTKKREKKMSINLQTGTKSPQENK